MNETNNTPGGVSEASGRVSLNEIKAKRGRKTDDEIIQEYLRKQQAGGAGAGEGARPVGPMIVLQPRHVEGLSNVPFAGIGWLTKEPLWNLTKDEQEFLSAPLADFLNEILPELARKYPKGAVLAISFVSMATVKMAQIANKKPQTVMPAAPAPAVQRTAPGGADVGADGMTAFERNLRKRERGELAA